MIIRLCDRCRAELTEDHTMGSYRAVLKRRDGQEEVIAGFADVCTACIEELRKHHRPARRRRRSASSVTRAQPRRRLTRQEAARLRRALVEVLEARGGQATNDEIIQELKQREIELPGRSPARNLTSYLSRHPQIESVRPGLWALADAGDTRGPGVAASSGAEKGGASENGQT